MKDYERVRDQLIALTAPVAGEAIEALGWFLRAGTTQDSATKGLRWLRRTFAPRADVPGDQLGMYGIVVLTPSRLMVVKARPGPPIAVPQRVIGAWPRGEVRMERESLTTDSYAKDRGTTRTRVVRVTLHFPDGTAPLAMDFLARDGLTKEIVPALESALAQ